MVNLARPMFSERLGGIRGRGSQEYRLRFAGFGRLGKHLQSGRGYFVLADFSVYPDCVRHLDHLYFSEKICDLFAAFAFVGYRFAGLALCRPADGENFFPRALFTDLIRR